MPGKITHSAQARSKEAKRLTALLLENETFVYLRIGDMEMTSLYGLQEGILSAIDSGDGNIQGTRPHANPGLNSEQIQLLWKAYEKADYVDFWDIHAINGSLRNRLNIKLKQGATCNPNAETSYILPTWMHEQFKEFVSALDHPIGIASAEAGVLDYLLKNSVYRNIAKDIFPDDLSLIRTHGIRERGRNLDKNLWIIKKDLTQFVNSEGVRVLFLGLGGGAKILGVELAEELGIRVIDFGALTRGLCYLGSDGNRAARSPHLVYFFELPFGMVMEAQEQAFPDLKNEELLAKAHAQLILDLQKREIAWSTPSWELSFDDISRNRFKKGFTEYKKRYSSLFRANEYTRQERNSFLYFCGGNNLTFEGKMYYLIFKIKAIVARIIKRLFKVEF